MVNGHKNLDAWKEAMRLAELVYSHTESFPQKEQYGLTSQLRRAAVSVPSNIAEGAARHTTQEFIRFVATARGSIAEIETQILLARTFGYLSHENADIVLKQLDSVARLSTKLFQSLKQKTIPHSPITSHSHAQTHRP
jgi:four helix bundle protein